MTALAAVPPVQTRPRSSLERRICLLADYLAGFEYEEVVSMLQRLGVTGADLTGRTGGLVGSAGTSCRGVADGRHHV